MKSAISRTAEELRRLEVEIRRASDPFTRRLREEELARLRARLQARRAA